MNYRTGDRTATSVQESLHGLLADMKLLQALQKDFQGTLAKQVHEPLRDILKPTANGLTSQERNDRLRAAIVDRFARIEAAITNAVKLKITPEGIVESATGHGISPRSPVFAYYDSFLPEGSLTRDAMLGQRPR